ncbi:2-hexaprenyl-6-methoxy-1,4-benzoquinone methyltransferase [Ascosphaera pollenicola]|nr:2-hexaprenyl-6-methoxy-1,4-benzoquinone methyltransferase [Ascosphaera pollenicola]
MGIDIKQVVTAPKTFPAKDADQIFNTLINETSPSNQRFGSQTTFTGVTKQQYEQVKQALKARKARHEGAVFKTKYDASKQTVKYVREDAIRSAIQPTLADIFKHKLSELTVLKHFTDEGRQTLGDGVSEGEADFAWKDKSEVHNGWPSGVVEIGYVPTTGDVNEDVAFWFDASKGQVHVVLAIKVSSRGEMDFKVYQSDGVGSTGKHVTHTAHIIPPPAEREPAVVNGAPIVLTPSQHAKRPEVVFDEEDLKRVGEEVWFVLKSQLPTPGVWTTEGGRLPTPES